MTTTTATQKTGSVDKPPVTEPRVWNRQRSIAPYAMVLLLLLEIVIFSLLSPEEFATLANFRTTLVTQAVLGILTLGMLMPLVAGQFDVSLAMVFTTAMLTAASLEVNFGFPLWLSAIVALGVATVLGAVSGIVVVFTRADSLVVTLGMLTILRGLSEAITGGDTITIAGPSGETLRGISSSSVLGIPLPVYFLVVLAFVLWFVTEQTPIGRYFYAVGGSTEGARLAGLRTKGLQIGAFASGGLLAGVAGLVQLSKSVTATANFGAGFLFPSLAAAFLGAAAFKLGAFNVRGAMTAILLLAVGVTGIRMSGAPLWIDEVFNGAALVAAVAIVRFIRNKEVSA